MEGKIKVVWICHFSDAKTRSHIRFAHFYYRRVINFILRRNNTEERDFAIWISNAIQKFEKYDDVDLTIIFPHLGIKGENQYFSINGINYICFRSEDDNWYSFLRNRLFHIFEKKYIKNRRLIASEIANIRPDIIHIIGAENPYYSIAALDLPESIPSVVSLQTLISDPQFFHNFPMAPPVYEYRTKIEKTCITMCNYIATRETTFKYIIKSNIKPNAVFLNMTLAVGVDVDESPCNKEYDFVYFAANISKAADYAIEAFAIACKKHPELTLNLSGACSLDFKRQLDLRIYELGIAKNIFFTGAKTNHADVIAQIKKSRYALLPLKVDLISGTIREAMACGLPVVSTITPATPLLNCKRESILLSEKGDYVSMAANMLKLFEDEDYANTIRSNAIQTIRENYSNESFMKIWHDAYFEMINNFRDGEAFSNLLIS